MTKGTHARLRFEARQHRAQAVRLLALARTAPNPLIALQRRSEAAERRRLAKQADDERRAWLNAVRASQEIACRTPTP